MKSIILIIACLLYVLHYANAQNLLVPAENIVDKKWLKNRQYEMGWYAVKDTITIEIGKVQTEVINSNNHIMVITKLNLKQAKSPWIDSTIADNTTLAPVYHSSRNAQRDMALHFGKIVTGFYTDKRNNHTTAINDTTNASYFDSNLYPALIPWLPLSEGYGLELPIYDYNPSGKQGVIKAFVKEVKSGTYTTALSGNHDIWLVTVTDEIGNGENGTSTYFIDKVTRTLWQQEISIGDRKMKMVLVEK